VAVQEHRSLAGVRVQRLQHPRRIQAWQPVRGVGKVAVVTQQRGNPDPSDTARGKVFQRQLRPVLGYDLPTVAVVLQVVE
jgi:hypothetical protein